jgi:ABC-type sugar transport system permease subunit/ABC-type glycerol-3-phosphate transport system substrate-binding protein
MSSGDSIPGRKQRVRTAVLICAALALLAFAATRARAGTPLTLRVSGLPSETAMDPASVASSRVVAEFQKRHPEIRIVAAEGLKIETVTSEANTIMMIAGGIAPDVIQMNFRSIDTFVRQGMVAPLDPFLEAEGARGAERMGAILPQIRPILERTGHGGVKAIYALPGPLLVMGLYYNREAFRVAGLPDRAPRDWNELVAFGKSIERADPSLSGLLLSSGATASWMLMNFLWSAGGDAVVEVAPDEWRAAFNTPEAVEAYKFYYQIVEIDRIARRMPGSLATHELERFGMMFRYVGDVTQLDPQLWGFGAVPRGPNGARGSEINAILYGIYSGLTDPQKRQAAWKFIAFFTGEEADRIRVATFLELGLAQQMNPALLRKHGFDEFLHLLPPGIDRELEEAVRNGHPEPYGKNCNLVYNEMTYPLDQILLSNEIRRDWGDDAAVDAQIREILDRAVAKTNERMIGHVPLEQMELRRVVACVVVLALLVVFTSVGWYVSRLFNRNAAAMSRSASGKSWIPWLCLAPAAALILVWHYLPLARGTVMAFQDYRIILDSAFVGLDNFASVLFDATFWNSILATIHFAAWTLTLGFVLPILLAYALHLIPTHKVIYRTLYYLPAVISGTAVFFLWRELFGLDGVLNQALRVFGFAARRAWTEDPYLAMLSCVLPGIWAATGPGCLIYLAALKTIPMEQFEAAEIDGAGFFQKTRCIVYPGLRALIGVNFVGAVAAAFHGATNILVMTGGGPNGLTEVTSLLIFFEGFTRLRFGTATAMAWILGSMLIGFTVLQLKRLSDMEFKTAR